MHWYQVLTLDYANVIVGGKPFCFPNMVKITQKLLFWIHGGTEGSVIVVTSQ